MQNAQMNAMIFAAGAGTRLQPLTFTLPKALVQAAGKPLLQHVLDKLRDSGFDNIVVNVHHHASQIIDYLKDTDVKISKEEELLDTGGGLRAALPLFGNDGRILVHNVDILNDADLRRFYDEAGEDSDVCLLLSRRQTKRYLLFDNDMRMTGWTNAETGEVRSPYEEADLKRCSMYAFSGIHCVSPRIAGFMKQWPCKFPIMDFYIKHCRDIVIKGIVADNLHLLDVGKPDTLRRAEEFLCRYGKKRIRICKNT